VGVRVTPPEQLGRLEAAQDRGGGEGRCSKRDDPDEETPESRKRPGLVRGSGRGRVVGVLGGQAFFEAAPTTAERTGSSASISATVNCF